MADQLFERMDKNYDHKVSVDEFLKVYLEAEDALKTKLENTKKHIKEYQAQKKEALKKLEEARRTEIINSYGIQQDAVVHVTVLEGQNIKVDGYSPIVCQIELRGDRQVTKGANPPDPIWNQNLVLFEFLANLVTQKQEMKL